MIPHHADCVSQISINVHQCPRCFSRGGGAGGPSQVHQDIEVSSIHILHDFHTTVITPSFVLNRTHATARRFFNNRSKKGKTKHRTASSDTPSTTPPDPIPAAAPHSQINEPPHSQHEFGVGTTLPTRGGVVEIVGDANAAGDISSVKVKVEVVTVKQEPGATVKPPEDGATVHVKQEPADDSEDVPPRSSPEGI